MKLLLCRDMRLGAICTANLNAEKAQAWNIARYRKFEHLLHTATKDDVGYVILFGRLFGSKLVSGEYIDAISNLISRETNIQVITCLTEEDSHRIASASNTPENLHVLWPSSEGQYEDEKICVSQDEEEIYIEAKAEKNRMTVNRENYRINGSADRVPSFEPCGYEDAAKDTFGYMITRITEKEIRNDLRPETTYAFRFLKMTITPNETESEIIGRAGKLVSANDADTFVRLVLNGTTGIGVEIDTRRISNELMQYVFFIEVLDESRIDLSDYKPDSDISLANEFVRLAMNDLTLSEADRSTVIRNGWNALSNGEEK